MSKAIDTGDDEVLDDGALGVVTWYLLLASRIDPNQALEAADGWGGDAYAYFERDGAVCVEARFEGDTETDVDQMEQALEAWHATMPAGPTVERDGGELPAARVRPRDRGRPRTDDVAAGCDPAASGARRVLSPRRSRSSTKTSRAATATR